MDVRENHDTADHGRNIATLARQLRISEEEVSIVYRRMLDELTASARIRNYLGILAMSTTRTILHHRAARQTVH